jgi:serine-type D-Ala-D-Ala carboxypeptidase/endopeptidase (penicillin-binding protein 4)
MAALFNANRPGGPVWSVRVESLTRPGDPIFTLQPDQLMVPASNMKIVTLAVAADRLGWDHTFPTTIRSTSPMWPDGTIRGDLVVRGTGDPMIGTLPASRTSMTAIADALWQQGVRRINGRIIGDDDAYADEPLGEGWAWDDVSFTYSAPIGPLIYNENSATITVTPGMSPGMAVSASIVDRDTGLTLANQLTTGAPDSAVSIDMTRAPGSAALKLHGSVPANGNATTVEAAVPNPTLYFASALRSALVARGIVVRGGAADIDAAPAGPLPAGVPALLTWPSASLADIGKRLMKVSQNLYAETLLRGLAVSNGHAATAREGEDIVGSTLKAWGVAEGGIVVADGSGLSRYNLVSATSLVRVLTHVYQDPRLKDGWMDAMPVGGVDGTLGRRLKDTPAAGRVHAKTGSLSGVRALSGYVQTAEGEWIAFSMLANNFGAPASAADVDRVVDQALVRLASFKRD